MLVCVPWHGVSFSQISVFTEIPLHGLPPLEGRGLVQDRVSRLSPVPQVFEHDPAFHPDQLPSTESIWDTRYQCLCNASV